ncbi:MAG: zinc ribbon domain-containing protein, partial [Candidatus Methanoperedens sp.]|nr:zinc ribbon domain-containing protein [Candidatus Methanoperedens sp.]
LMAYDLETVIAFKNIMVRKYTYPEPAINLGIEQPIPIATTPIPTTPTPTTPVPTTPEIKLQVTPTPSLPPLALTFTSEPASIAPGSTSTITVTVTDKDGREIPGAGVMLSSIPAGKINPTKGTTDAFGQVTATLTAPAEGKVTVRAIVKKEGFIDGSGEIVLEQSRQIPTPTAILTPTPTPLSKQEDGKDLWVIALVFAILIVAAVLIYFMWKRREKAEEKIKKTPGAKKEETKEEKKKFCMFCHAPMPQDAEFCPKCGKKQDETKRFCMNCGALMPAVPELCSKCSKMPPSDVDTKTCKNCGEVIPKVAKFCSACGAGQPE